MVLLIVTYGILVKIRGIIAEKLKTSEKA
jgi:hypothetical protein